MQRFFEIDALRGIAVIAMVAFHALFDLNFFAGYGFDLYGGVFFALGRSAAIIFIFIAGVSLAISHARAKAKIAKPQLFKKFFSRGLGIFSLGLLITAATWLLFPREFIVFGVLHLIGLTIILAFPFLSRKKTSAAAGALLILLGLLLGGMRFNSPWLLWLGFVPMGFTTFDYFPILPWFGVALIGIFAGNILYPDAKRRFAIPEFSGLAPIKFLSFLGRNSLAIYFLHQPVLVGLMLLLA